VNQPPGRGNTPGTVRLTPWLPCLVAIGLMAVGIYQVQTIRTLEQRLASVRSEVVTLQRSNALTGLHLATLEAKDAAYGAARIIVAWDPNLHRGVVFVRHLVAPPAGHDYQLWVLDPQAEAPISAGVIKVETPSRNFAVHPLSVAGPGFAVSLEPADGQAAPTGPILFAVEPEE
jgi:hypothetical protein